MTVLDTSTELDLLLRYYTDSREAVIEYTGSFEFPAGAGSQEGYLEAFVWEDKLAFPLPMPLNRVSLVSAEGRYESLDKLAPQISDLPNDTDICLTSAFYLPDDTARVELSLYSVEKGARFPFSLRLVERAPEFR